MSANHFSPTAGVLYKARDINQSQKMMRFFGEHSLPIMTGSGSSNKLQSFFVSLPLHEGASKTLEEEINSELSSTNTSANPLRISTSSLETLIQGGQTSPRVSRRFSMPSPNGSANNGGSSALGVTSALAVPPSVSRSSSKIDQLMGMNCPADISVKEIERGGLVSLLNSKIPLCFFLTHLITHRNPEILFFCTDVMEYETKVYPTFEAQQHAAHVIFQLYLTPKSPLELNVSERARKLCAANIKLKGNRNCFDAPNHEALIMLDESFTAFKESNYWKMMENVLGNNVIHVKSVVNRVKTILNHVLDLCYFDKSKATNSNSVGSSSNVPLLNRKTEEKVLLLDDGSELKAVENEVADVLENQAAAAAEPSEPDSVLNNSRLQEQVKAIHHNVKLFVNRLVG